MMGLDPMTGASRFTFGDVRLLNGIEFIPVMIGAFALAEVLKKLSESLEAGFDTSGENISLEALKLKDLLMHKIVLLKSSLIGTVIGILPGTGGSIASIVSYGEAVRSGKNKEEFGKGCEEGIIAPEAANNAAAGGAMIPTLVLGIPGSPTTAIILAALTLQGLQPGPQLMTEQPLMLYSIFFSMFIASVVVFFGGRLGVKAFAAVLKLPYGILGPIIVAFSIIGSYAITNDMFQVWIMIFFGIVGFFFKKFEFSGAALVLGLVLGSMMEENFRRQLVLTDGNYMSFFQRPISLIILIIVILTVVYPIISSKFKKAN